MWVLTTFSTASKQSGGGEHPARDPLVSLGRQRASPACRSFRRDSCGSRCCHNLAVHCSCTERCGLSSVSKPLFLDVNCWVLDSFVSWAFNSVWRGGGWRQQREREQCDKAPAESRGPLVEASILEVKTSENLSQPSQDHF